ncbi:MAG: ABC-F family ATP-binding cassette domain-containing protein [Deltaproteobacteria bacterium]|nr:ABC-F family ATP-binding cassette domain-containing protein [Deltaproteobacteria bacterium]
MISVNNLSKSYGGQVLFKEVSLQFDPGNRYGIVGANGAGKSTFVRILCGQESPDTGTVNLPAKIRVGTLNQDHFAFEDDLLIDVVMQGQPDLYRAFSEKDELLEEAEPDPERIIELEEIIAHHDGYQAESRIAEMLEGLGIATVYHKQPMRVLSGGYKLRVLLAQCLFSRPEVLLLDEPTNHLDIVSVRWLEDYLVDYKGTVIVVSHDRDFINRVSTHIADIDYQTIKIYPGNYDYYLKARELDELQRRQESEKAEKKIDELQAFVTRFKGKATKARQAQSKIKQINRMEKEIVKPVYSSRIHPRIRFECCRPSGKTVLEVDSLSKAYGSKQVLNEVSFTVERGERLAVIGPNGIGKSTLLKIIMNELEADAGKVTWGYETWPEYFSQDHRELIPVNTTPYEYLYSYGPGESIGTIRGILGNLLFTGDDVHKSTAALSGGEAARLIIAKLVLKKGNVLVLDEPTNHLDLESIEAFIDALSDFEGTIIFVSHNRYLVNRLATRILELKAEGFDTFPGTYQEYLEHLGCDHLSGAAAAGERPAAPTRMRETKKPEEKTGNREDSENRPGKNQPARKQQKQTQDKMLRKKINQQLRPLKKESSAAEALCEQLEKEVEKLNRLFSSPDYYSQTPPDTIKRQAAEKKEAEEKLAWAYHKWEQLNQEIEELEKELKV